MNLIIDAGNSRTKLAVFDADTLVHLQTGDNNNLLEQVREVCDRFPSITRSIVANVGSLDPLIIEVLSVFNRVHILTAASKQPFKNSYATPNTLGVDRIALATAAFYRYPRTNTLVLDAGTCLTYDMLSANGEYLGGAISPGLNMRYRALNHQTARLPLLQPGKLLDFIGTSTESSMHSGVINGITLEMDGVIDQYRARFNDLTVILTGGDAHFLSLRLKNTIFADSNFLLTGLNYLLEYNEH